MKLNKTAKISILCASVLVFSFGVTTAVRTISFYKPKALDSVKISQIQTEIDALLDQKYPRRTEILKSLPYSTKPAELDVWAENAICIDVENGNIIYEKDADKVIPPASMTKLFLMYVVFEEIRKGTVKLDDVIPLVPESWASHMMPHSSLMFLGENQRVTLDELLMGLSICSGNDASYAIAYHISGGMDAFIEKMNEEARRLGLKNTHFVESSGYSELNTTTPREMAVFCREYLFRFPESIKYHSALSFTYPKEHNLAPEDVGKPREQDFSNGFPDHITMPITQKNTNPLLGVLSGCDGLKTGYIDESGYNLALTCRRNGLRFLSVTMKGPGTTVSEGQKGRVHDGEEIMEWAYKTFDEYKNPLLLRPYVIPVFNAVYPRINLVPAYKPESLLVPRIIAKNAEKASDEVKIELDVPETLNGKIEKGGEYGSIKYVLNGYVLETVPLVAERELKKANFWLCAADFLAKILYK